MNKRKITNEPIQEGFRQSGLRIRTQRKKYVCISTPNKINDPAQDPKQEIALTNNDFNDFEMLFNEFEMFCLMI